MPNDPKRPDLITEREAAHRLGVSPVTLKRWRFHGVAPPRVQYPSGTIRYDRSEVDAFRRRSRRT